LANSRGARKKASLASTRCRAPADSVIEHLQHTYIHPHTHAHTHTQITSEIHAHAHAAIVFYDSLQLTSSMHEAKKKGHRAHGQNKIMHAYGPKSTTIAQGLVEDINAQHAYGPRSAPIAQGLVYDINSPHAFGLRESKRTYGFVSTPIAQGLVEIINSKGTKMVMSPKAQGLVINTHHSKTCMVKHHTHDRMSWGKTTKRQNSGSVGKKTTSSDETNHVVVSLLPTELEEDSSRMSGGKGGKRTNSGSAVKKTTFSDETNHATVSLLPKKEDSNWWVSTLVPLTLLMVVSIHAAKLNENRMLYNVSDSDATKVQIMGYNLTQIKGQTLDTLWVFSSVENFFHRNFLDTIHGQKSRHLMASSHSGFSLFYHYNLQGSCLRTVIQPLAETTGLLISWVFSF